MEWISVVSPRFFEIDTIIVRITRIGVCLNLRRSLSWFHVLISNLFDSFISLSAITLLHRNLFAGLIALVTRLRDSSLTFLYSRIWLTSSNSWSRLAWLRLRFRITWLGPAPASASSIFGQDTFRSCHVHVCVIRLIQRLGFPRRLMICSLPGAVHSIVSVESFFHFFCHAILLANISWDWFNDTIWARLILHTLDCTSKR